MNEGYSLSNTCNNNMNVTVIEDLPKPIELSEQDYLNTSCQYMPPPTPDRKRTKEWKKELPSITMEAVSKFEISDDDMKREPELHCVFFNDKNNNIYRLFDDGTYTVQHVELNKN